MSSFANVSKNCILTTVSHDNSKRAFNAINCFTMLLSKIEQLYINKIALTRKKIIISSIYNSQVDNGINGANN